MHMEILIVDDEPLVAELIRESLQSLGMSCRVAVDADAADHELSLGSADAVTLALGMPGRSGLAWLESIADSQPDLARRTLVITGLSLEKDLVERLARCGAGILAKPFSLDGLRDAVRTQLGNSRIDTRTN